MAALTPEQVREIRINPKGKTWVEFMAEFGCSRDTISASWFAPRTACSDHEPSETHDAES